MNQQTLDFTAAERADINAARPLSKAEQKRRKFEAFHAANPHVYRLIVDRARQKQIEGYRSWAIEEIWNHLRWHLQCKTTGKPYRLCNDHKKPYVELLASQYPTLGEMFHRKGKRDGT